MDVLSKLKSYNWTNNKEQCIDHYFKILIVVYGYISNVPKTFVNERHYLSASLLIMDGIPRTADGTFETL